MLLGVFELPLYALRHGRILEAARAALSMVAGSCLVLLLWRRCWNANMSRFTLQPLESLTRLRDRPSNAPQCGLVT
jgi:hypothetical protein